MISSVVMPLGGVFSSGPSCAKAGKAASRQAARAVRNEPAREILFIVLFYRISGLEGLPPSSAGVLPAPRKSCYTFSFALEASLGTSRRRGDAAGQDVASDVSTNPFPRSPSCAVSFSRFLLLSLLHTQRSLKPSIPLLSKT